MKPCGCDSVNNKTPDISYSEAASSSQSDHSLRKIAQGVCKNVVHEDVCIAAQVSIDPIVDIGPISTHCLSRPEIAPCDSKCVSGGSCSFVVRQRICVEVPIAFGASTSVDPMGIACDGAETGPCKCAH